MAELTPLWKTPTRAQAVEILRACRASTEATIAPLSPKQLTMPTVLGDGTWSIKDLLGHLATWEERALVTAGLRSAPKRAPAFASVAEFNAHHLERKRAWSLAKVRKDYDAVRTDLVVGIEAMDDERWYEKIDVGGKRSALALVLAKMLNGDKHGLFAHDLAHARDLERAARELSEAAPPARG